MLGSPSFIIPVASQAVVFSSLLDIQESEDSDMKSLKSITGRKGLYDSKATEEYGKLNAVVAQSSESRRLGGSASTVKIPFDFIETVAPILALFGLMIIFFIVMKLVSKRTDNKTISEIALLLKFNAVIRFGLIFYLPLQIACI